jgi:hypothetical protein
METSIGAVSRVRQFESETADENLEGEDGVVPLEWPSRGAIEIENLTVSYRYAPPFSAHFLSSIPYPL